MRNSYEIFGEGKVDQLVLGEVGVEEGETFVVFKVGAEKEVEGFDDGFPVFAGKAEEV